MAVKYIGLPLSSVSAIQLRTPVGSRLLARDVVVGQCHRDAGPGNLGVHGILGLLERAVPSLKQIFGICLSEASVQRVMRAPWKIEQGCGLSQHRAGRRVNERHRQHIGETCKSARARERKASLGRNVDACPARRRHRSERGHGEIPRAGSVAGNRHRYKRGFVSIDGRRLPNHLIGCQVIESQIVVCGVVQCGEEKWYHCYEDDRYEGRATGFKADNGILHGGFLDGSFGRRFFARRCGILGRSNAVGLSKAGFYSLVEAIEERRDKSCPGVACESRNCDRRRKADGNLDRPDRSIVDGHGACESTDDIVVVTLPTEDWGRGIAAQNIGIGRGHEGDPERKKPRL